VPAGFITVSSGCVRDRLHVVICMLIRMNSQHFEGQVNTRVSLHTLSMVIVIVCIVTEF